MTATPHRDPGAALAQLVAVMDRLRRECAWDAKQTHRSLVEYLLEETHETIEAIEADDADALREELGDLLLQVVFHARIADETHDWGIAEVADDIVAKLVRRHPHVFGAESQFAALASVGTTDADTLSRNWTAIKAAEKSRDSAMDGIPATLPALALAQKSWRRALAAGVAPGPADGGRTPPVTSLPDTPESLGAQLLELVQHAEHSGWDAESALRVRTRRLHDEVRSQEGRRARNGPDPEPEGP